MPVESHLQPSILSALPPDEARIVTALSAQFGAAGKELYLVGGVVRDILLGTPNRGELDFTTNALPEETERLGVNAGAGAVYLVGARFGTVGMVFDGPDPDLPISVEITTYRAEHYPDQSRKPSVEFGASLVDDLSRRDFTINAVAADALSGLVIDPYHGQADLLMSRIRAVGDADQRFDEDPLRLLRAARFVAQLGFAIETETADAMVRQAESLGRISRERIYGELTRLLVGPYASHGLDALHTTGLFPIVLPEIRDLPEQEPRPGDPHEKDLWEHTKRVIGSVPSRPTVRWAALLHDSAKPRTRSISPSGEVHFFGHERVGSDLAGQILTRLNADKATQVAVRRVVELHSRPETYDNSWTDSAVRRLMLDAGAHLPDLLDLATEDVTSARAEKQKLARKRIDALRAHIAHLEAERALADYQSPLNGTELIALCDRPPGKWIAEIKDHLRELVIDGELDPDDKEGAERLALTMISSI